MAGVGRLARQNVKAGRGNTPLAHAVVERVEIDDGAPSMPDLGPVKLRRVRAKRKGRFPGPSEALSCADPYGLFELLDPPELPEPVPDEPDEPELDDPDVPEPPLEPDEPPEPMPDDPCGFAAAPPEPEPRPDTPPVLDGSEPREVLVALPEVDSRLPAETPVRVVVLLPPRTETPERSRTLAPTPTDTPVDVREWMVRRLRTDTLDGSS